MPIRKNPFRTEAKGVQTADWWTCLDELRTFEAQSSISVTPVVPEDSD